jgi:hypothetical protein
MEFHTVGMPLGVLLLFPTSASAQDNPNPEAGGVADRRSPG